MVIKIYVSEIENVALITITVIDHNEVISKKKKELGSQQIV